MMQPNLDPRVLFQQALQLQQLKRFSEAEEIYRRILKKYPSHTGPMTFLGLLLIEKGQNKEGIKLLKSSLNYDPAQFIAHNGLGVGLLNTNNPLEAKPCFQRAASIKPDFIEAHFNLGKSLRQLKKYQEAVDAYTQCLKLNPAYADAYNNRGVIYQENLGLHDLALADFERYIELVPGSAEGKYNLGNALKDLGDLDAAIASYKEAIQLKPDYTDAYNNLGLTLSDSGELEKAIRCHDQAIKINPQLPESYRNLGRIFLKLNHLEESLANYELAYKIDPNSNTDEMIHTKMKLCSWNGFSKQITQLEKKIRDGAMSLIPGAFLEFSESPAVHKRCAETHAHQYESNKSKYVGLKHQKHKKIRVAYFSADFFDPTHPVMVFMENLLSRHDKSRFELYGFALTKRPDKYDKSYPPHFNQFFDIHTTRYEDVLKLTQELEIDIVVDLTGYTQNCVPSLFAQRVAPVQVAYLGYPGTTGIQSMDYIVADKVVIPDDLQTYYTENVIYMPDSFWVTPAINDKNEFKITREEAGLPSEGFIYCAFNNHFKITPNIFDSWMRILNKVENSYLWLQASNQTIVNNLKKEAKLRGVDEERLIFASRVPNKEDHYRRLKLADLFLDTFPYGAHTTAHDALRCNVPLLTLEGDSFASRVGASMLFTLELPELITTTQPEYEERAIYLAENKNQLAAIKLKLEANFYSSPICDVTRYIKKLESAYQQIYERHANGLSPDNIYVE
jgi:predicted O-linked N-acetylglucosamine transferase (SPINDLY family)